MEQVEVHSLEGLELVAQQFIQKHPTGVFCVEGEMGAGKTTFISTIAKLLGEENTSSPTFSLVNEYHLRNNERMYHFDLYRVKSKAELQEFGFEDYLFGARYVFIEWPEVAFDYLYEHHFLRIREENGKRVFEF
jgi:tRNA threonylcarbamoyladenosine biosynthesis protein TsaE